MVCFGKAPGFSACRFATWNLVYFFICVLFHLKHDLVIRYLVIWHSCFVTFFFWFSYWIDINGKENIPLLNSSFQYKRNNRDHHVPLIFCRKWIYLLCLGLISFWEVNLVNCLNQSKHAHAYMINGVNVMKACTGLVKSLHLVILAQQEVADIRVCHKLTVLA